ncbi:helix-turn-helix transcriptional regulator [Nesterenkonia alkaliphila]|uniref:Helix-turn-helix domain-containing protein n=1 Tax=Nesterenkonia alkaliphila TaxID=1463631 RepID=A0A7K1UG67_9MICC|nr:AraC family transcriptional regulator [Nesterenkonia alkaliphila]MVT25091.1 helix-turn-helix domain-containing protein [Nesterenkonia alkaliphila]
MSKLQLQKSSNHVRTPVIVRERTDFTATGAGPDERVRVVFVLNGWAYLDAEARSERLCCGSVVTIPADTAPWLRPHGLVRTAVFHLHRTYVADQLRWLSRHHPLVHHLHRSLQDPLTLGHIKIPSHTMQALTPLLLRATQLACTSESEFALLATVSKVFDAVGKASGSNTFTGNLGGRFPRRETAAAMQLLQSHPDHGWTVGDLARTVLVSTAQLNRAFRADLGVSPAAYLRQIRVDRMAELLSTTTIGVSEAASAAGWSNPTVASRAFKKRYGVSPRAFAAAYPGV